MTLLALVAAIAGCGAKPGGQNAGAAATAAGGAAVGGPGAGGAGAGAGGAHSAAAGAGASGAGRDAGPPATAANDGGGPPDAAMGGAGDAGGNAAIDAGAVADGGAASCPGAKPTASNTGVPPGVTLAEIDQDVTVSQDGTVIDGQDIHGFLTIKASHVQVLRSIVRGHATSATTAIIRIDSGSDILLQEVEVAAAEPSVDVDGVSGSNFTARRLNIHGGVDGMKLGSNTRVECSYLHDLMSFSSDPNQGGGATHNDAIQILSGTGIYIVGNQLVAAMSQNAAIQITQDFGMVGDVHIEHNWADGGGCTFNISHNGGNSLSDVYTTGNRFGRNSYFDCPILKSTKTTLVSTDDVWDDSDMEVPIQTHD